MNKKHKWKSPQSTLRERLEQRAQRRESSIYADADPDCKQTGWENIPVSMLTSLHSHMFQKTVAAIVVVICLGLFSLLNLPITSRLTDAVHYLTVHQMNPAELLEAAKPVMQSVREFNWRRSGNENPDPLPEPSTGEEMAAPVNGVLSSPYGPRMNTVAGQMEVHYGIDVTTDPGAAVYAALSGTVTLVKEHPPYGLTIYVTHPGDLVTIYGRVADVRVVIGDRVTQQQIIAAVAPALGGESHLHFEVWKNSEPVNPEDFFAESE